jgi:hypothetical protein
VLELTFDQGLRGMNWSASIAQLVCIILMTVLRALVRRGLTVMPICYDACDQHEMDWLALRIVQSDAGKDFWPNKQEFEPKEPRTSTNTDQNQQPKTEMGWKVCTASQHNYDHCSNLETGKAQKALKVRQRLGKLTKWTGKTSQPAVAVATSIGAAMDTLWGNELVRPFIWPLMVQMHSSTEPEKVEFRVENINGQWKADATEIDAALSLWAFYVYDMEAKGMGKNADSDKGTATTIEDDWLQQGVELRRQTTRVLGQNTQVLRRDIGWWIGKGALPSTSNVNLGGDEGPGSGYLGSIGFLGLERFGLEGQKQDSSE